MAAYPRRAEDARAHRPAVRRVLTVSAAAAVLLVSLPALPAAAEDTTSCTFPSKKYPGRPWSLQRVLLDELWKQSTGKGVRVAVIDTGVDVRNEQLTPAVDTEAGRNFLPKGLKTPDGVKIERGKENGTTDTVGHGTKVAGIIAAREAKGTGFTGIAPDATIIPIQQNDAEGHGDTATLADAITYAVDKADADVINISQDTADAVKPSTKLKEAVDRALAQQVVVVASAGNDGLGGNVKETYPASFDGVLAVASSDRNNERAPFSQSGDFVGIAAPGVDMVSTVPGGGHCADNGTSFSAPYVAGVAALIRAKHRDWTQAQIVAQIQQTAERSVAGHDNAVGWGVVDPVRALTEDDRPIDRPVASEGMSKGKAPTPAELPLGETADERNARLATYVVVGGGVLVAAIAGTAVAVRDRRRRMGRTAAGT
ncbi:type VII secretion-associated serine protease mycosin [Streptomyces sp. CB04723]|uniref:type VII secretion-associated serine protease mycosin n=1 Tax=Streptomyces TaxID=1883 RepID=UPI0015C47996|nr:MULTISPECIES: type VII secretion-associated serine protease mycosin [Streptomyces]MCF3169350.1 type VII secretion-associated serine protease mycosin [Streptomyces violaceoruber]QLG31631.1 type VII secretion-associated serine protease mycosin [Streptomyces sp. CB04723]